MLWTVLGTVVPGVGLMKAGRKVAGAVALGITVFVVAGLAFIASDRQTLFTVALTPSVLKALTIGLIVAGILWATLIAATHLSLRPSWATAGQRVAGSLLVGLLVFGITAPMAVAARYAYDQATLVTTVFKEQESATRPTITPAGGGGGTKQDVWQSVPRLNVLLVGIDDSSDREYGDLLTNTDTMIIASIDTKTGNTVLAGIPRNTMKMPFPKDSPLYQKYRNGWPEMANAMFAHLPQNVDKNILGPTSSLGMDALKLSIGEAVGVRVDYYVMVNLDGMHSLVEALGGVTVNINDWIAVGGDQDQRILPDRYLKPGPNQKLNADDAMSFARTRYGGSDFTRMARQRCLILGIVQQADPATLLTRYEAISKAGSKMVRTDVPAAMLPMFVELALRVKNAEIFGVTYADDNGWWVSANPDFARVKSTFQAAIKQSVEVKAAPTASATAAPVPASTTAAGAPTTQATSATTTAKGPVTRSSSAAPTPTQAAQNEADACAYTYEGQTTSSPPTRR